MLQNLVKVYTLLESQSVTKLDVERLKAFVGMETQIKPKKKEKRREEDQES